MKERLLLRTLLTDWIFLLAVFCVGIFLRLHLLSAANFTIDSDEAIVGLMANHILEGRNIPVFYYGQHYMGSLEPLLTAIAFKLFGSSPENLRIIPFLFMGALIPLTYLLGVVVNGVTAARVATLLIAVAPVAFIEWSVKARGGFIEIIFLITLVLFFTLYWKNKGCPLSGTALIGFLIGIGWWTNNQIIYVVPAVGLYFLIELFRVPVRNVSTGIKMVLLHFFVGVVLFLIGGFPFWVYNIRHHWISFKLFQPPGSLSANIHGFFNQALPIILGGRRFWNDKEIFPHSTEVIFLLYLVVAILLAIFSRRRQLLSRALLIFFILTACAAFVLSSFGSLVTAPRYLLALYPALFVLVGVASNDLKKVVPALEWVLIACFPLIHLCTIYLGEHAVPGEPFVYGNERASRDHSQLIAWLESHKFSWIETNYWIGYRLAFESGEKIKFKMFGTPAVVRIPEYETEVLSVPRDRIPIVVTPEHGKRLVRAFKALSVAYEQIELSGYVIFFDIRQGEAPAHLIPSTLMSVMAEPNNAHAQLAIDGNLKTRWGTAAHQTAGQHYDVSFTQEQKISFLELKAGEFTTDYPRELRVNCIKGDGVSEEIVSPKTYSDLKDGMDLFDVKLPMGDHQCLGLRFQQLGSDPIADWSIAELKIYG